MSEGRLIILSGPSGVGKDTVIDAWAEQNPAVERVVAFTTRAPRTGEVDGRDYHFVSVDRFMQHVEAFDFLEYKEVHGNHYATPLSHLEALLENGKIAVLKIDVQGALTVMNLRSDATSVFIMPPDVEELERRIRGRGTDEPEVIAKRLKNAQDEIALAGRYDHQVVNDDVSRVVAELEQIAAPFNR
jgi:guanylate kinase